MQPTFLSGLLTMASEDACSGEVMPQYKAASIIIVLYIYKRTLLDAAKVFHWIDSVELLYSAILKVNLCVNVYVVLNQV